MHVISRKRLREFWAVHARAFPPLEAWFKIARKADWASFDDVRAIYPRADQYGPLVVFDIGGNKYRLIAEFHYNRRKVFIRHVLTHADYDRCDWKRE